MSLNRQMSSSSSRSSSRNSVAANEYLIDSENASLISPSKGTYQQVFKAAGFGKWHFLLLAQCGWANASDAIEIMCISFTLDNITDSLKIQSNAVTWLTVVLFLGMMFGGYAWGSLADTWGRRKVIMYSLTVNGLFGCASAFAQSYPLILVLRFISGFGAGGSLPVCFSYFSEFQPTERRGAMISALATFWMAGNIFTAGLAWLVIPSTSLIAVSPFGKTWRFFIILCAIPSLTSALFFYLMPESPKFLMQSGKSEMALKVFKNIFKFNYPHKVFPFDGIIVDQRSREPRTPDSSYRWIGRRHKHVWGFFYCICNLFLSIGQTIKYQVMTVFGSGPKSLKNSLVLMVVYFSIAFGGYGVTMWLPTLMKKMEHNAGSICAPPPNVTLPPQNGSDTQVYIDVFIGAAAQLPANIFTILIMDRVGAKIIIVVSLVLSGISVLFMYLVSSKIQVVVVSAIFNCFSTIVWNGLDVITPEMYDTSIRAAATGLMTALSRIASILGNVIFGAFMETNCNVPLLTVTAVFLLGGLVSILLPNTRHLDLR